MLVGTVHVAEASLRRCMRCTQRCPGVGDLILHNSSKAMRRLVLHCLAAVVLAMVGKVLQMWRRLPPTGGPSSSSAALTAGTQAPAAAPAVAGAAAVAAGSQPTIRKSDFLQVLNPSATRVRWSVFEMEIYGGDRCCYWNGQWWVLRGASIIEFAYDPSTHWWEP